MCLLDGNSNEYQIVQLYIFNIRVIVIIHPISDIHLQTDNSSGSLARGGSWQLQWAARLDKIHTIMTALPDPSNLVNIMYCWRKHHLQWFLMFSNESNTNNRSVCLFANSPISCIGDYIVLVSLDLILLVLNYVLIANRLDRNTLEENTGSDQQETIKKSLDMRLQFK